MAPHNRRVAKQAAVTKKEKSRRLTKAENTNASTTPTPSIFRTPLVQTLLLSIGLALGLLYGWYFRERGDIANPSFHHLPYDEDLSAPYVVVDLPGKGKGILAIRDIQQGELILEEKPLFTVPPHITSSPVEFIQRKVELLTQAQKEAFFNLSHVNFPKDKDPYHDVAHVALAIFETNAVKAGDEVGIFPRMARLNHGCASAFNVIYSFRETGTLYVHAVKAIKKGEELLATYTDTKQPRDQRRAYLEKNYGFKCTCSACSLPDAESKASDRRLTQMADNWARFAKWIDGSINGVQALDIVRDIWRLGEEEGYWSERGRLAADAVWVAAGHSDVDAVQKWGELSREWFSYELGAGNEQVGFIERILEKPDSHPAWGSRERMAVGGPELGD